MDESDGEKRPRRVGPYRIEERLGAGGMGEVFRAYDERLHRQVALKQILPEAMEILHVHERFLLEARAAARLSHPAIVQVHDIIEADDGNWIVMELAEGELLSDLLSDGPLQLERQLALALDLAAGLEAAHAEGIVHRDLKAANVVVTPAGRAKILDFGLAKHLHLGDGDSSVTIEGQMLGTPQAMSPEQVYGGEVDHRSDLFSLGSLLYQMATGVKPFGGDGMMSIVARVCADQQIPAREVGPPVPRELSDLIDRLLEKNPDHRPQTAREVTLEIRRLAGTLTEEIELPLEWPSSVTPSASSMSTAAGLENVGELETIFETAPPPAVSASRVRRPWKVAGGVVLLVLSAVLAVAVLRFLNRSEPEASFAMRRSVAVLGFQNLSKRQDVAWLSTGFAEMLTAELAAGGELRMISGENVSRAKLELSLVETNTLASDTLTRLRAILGADLVVLGSYLSPPGPSEQLRLVLNVQDTTVGKTIATLSETESLSGILELVSKTGARLRQELGVGSLTASAPVETLVSLSNSPEALRLYSRGLERLRAFDFAAARELFTRAIEADPEHPLAHAALAETWSALGHDREARDQAARALELSAELSREDRLFVEGRYYEMAVQWERAIDTYRSLYRFFPDNLDYGLRLAGALTDAGRPREAIATIEVLRQLPSPFSDDVRIDLAEAEAARKSSEYQRMLAAGGAAAEKGEALGARILEARGRLAQASALLRLGDPRAAAPMAEKARQLFGAAGDRSGEARALNRIANIAYEEGDYREAKRIFEEALGIWRQVGNLKGIGRALNNVADTLMMQGELAAAQPLFEEALEISREAIGDPASEGLFNVNLAELALRRGDLVGARAYGRAGVELGRASSWSYGTYTGLWILSNVALEAGELEMAQSLLDEGVDLTREVGEQRYLAYMLYGLGDLAYTMGDLELARQRHASSLEIRESLGGVTESAESRFALALLSLEEEHPDLASRDLETALEVFSKRGLRESQAKVRAAQSCAALALGQTDEARKASGAAVGLLAGSQNVVVRLWSEIQIARCGTAPSDGELALSSLDKVIAEAQRKNLVRLEYDARLAAAEISQALDATGPGPYLRLAADAAAKNLPLIARKAARAAESISNR